MEVSKISELISRTKCDKRVAKLLLIFTGGDVDAAEKILKSIDKEIVVVKGKFNCQNIKKYGVFLIFYNHKTRTIEKTEFYIADNPSLFDVELIEPWENIYRLLVFMQQEGNPSDISYFNKEFHDRTLSEDLYSIIDGIFMDYKNNVRINDNYVISYLTDKISNLTAEVNLIVKVEFEFIDIFSFNIGISENEKLIEKNLDEEVISQTKVSDFENKGTKDDENIKLIILDCEPVYSPVSGVSAKDLNIGDFIKVKITDQTQAGKYISRLIGAIDENEERIPVKGKIVEVENMDSELLKIKVEFGPGIYGKVVCGADARLDAEAGEDEILIENNEEETPDNQGGISTKLLLIIIGALIFIFIILVLLI